MQHPRWGHYLDNLPSTARLFWRVFTHVLGGWHGQHHRKSRSR